MFSYQHAAHMYATCSEHITRNVQLSRASDLTLIRIDCMSLRSLCIVLSTHMHADAISILDADDAHYIRRIPGAIRMQ
jgi:hypothetical protein